MAFSSSKFAILVAEWLRFERIINIVYAEELDHPSYEEAVDHVFRLVKQLDNIKILEEMYLIPAYNIFKEKVDENSNWQIYPGKNTILQEKEFKYSSSILLYVP